MKCILVSLLLIILSVFGETFLKLDPNDGRKSLVIIFDGTNSMTPDLRQLHLAAKDIVNEFSTLDVNPIFNYILAVFRDPRKFQ